MSTFANTSARPYCVIKPTIDRRSFVRTLSLVDALSPPVNNRGPNASSGPRGVGAYAAPSLYVLRCECRRGVFPAPPPAGGPENAPLATPATTKLFIIETLLFMTAPLLEN